jgi:hypothetical protein
MNLRITAQDRSRRAAGCSVLCVEKDLNDPPTAVGGICYREARCFCSKDLNDPPTAVGGILQIARRVAFA